VKHFGPGQCIHCRRNFENLTSDHVFPLSWYPDSTPLTLEKWQAPACEACNAGHGKAERRLLQSLALGTDPWVAGAMGVGEKALRSIDPRAAKTKKDQQERQKAQDKFRRETKHASAIPGGDVLPNIGTIVPTDERGYVMGKVSAADVELLVRKIVRGITYLRTGQVIPDHYEIMVIPPSKIHKLPESWLQTSREIFERLPGFRVDRHYDPDDLFVAFFRIFIWERYEFCAIVTNSLFRPEPTAG